MGQKLDNIKDLLSFHEGRVKHAYQDHRGFWTIGVGHLIDKRPGGGLSDPQIDALLEDDIKHHTERLEANLPWVKKLDPVRRAVLQDMTFNMGITNVLGFKNTLAAIKDGEMMKAAAGMLQSKWAAQVGPRALRLATMMKTGEWPDKPQ
jgi:lysozyme